MDDEILQDEHESTLGRADRDEQIDHPDDAVPGAKDEDPPAVRLFQNQSQSAELLVPVGNEVRLVREQVEEQIRQLRQIVQGRRFDEGLVWHLWGKG
jgi:tetrahydromethanopterin S-methyltransferase subunit A